MMRSHLKRVLGLVLVCVLLVGVLPVSALAADASGQYDNYGFELTVKNGTTDDMDILTGLVFENGTATLGKPVQE